MHRHITMLFRGGHEAGVKWVAGSDEAEDLKRGRNTTYKKAYFKSGSLPKGTIVLNSTIL